MEVKVSRGEQPPHAPLAAPSPFELKAKTILRRMRKIDSWFLAGCGMNLYRGCGHDCSYCDGRAEKYQVQGHFGADVQVKVNAVEVLRRELGLQPRGQGELWPGEMRRHGGFVLLGGGVGDSYQPVEEQFGIARRVLELFAENAFPVHVLTKSTLVLRDIDVLERMARSSGALVSFSLSSANDALSSQFEPGASPPSERLRAVAALRSRGINAGVFLVPVLPFLTDSAESIEESVASAASAGARYVVFGGMTLKPGKQKDHYLETLGRVRPDLVERCRRLYAGPESERWGGPPQSYAAAVTRNFAVAARRHSMPTRIPLELASAAMNPREVAEMRRAHAKADRELSRYLT
jgi:DNA repair photolyase